MSDYQAILTDIRDRLVEVSTDVKWIRKQVADHDREIKVLHRWRAGLAGALGVVTLFSGAAAYAVEQTLNEVRASHDAIIQQQDQLIDLKSQLAAAESRSFHPHHTD